MIAAAYPRVMPFRRRRKTAVSSSSIIVRLVCVPLAPDRKPTFAARSEIPEDGNRGEAEAMVLINFSPANLPAEFTMPCLTR